MKYEKFCQRHTHNCHKNGAELFHFAIVCMEIYWVYGVFTFGSVYVNIYLCDANINGEGKK